MYRIINVKGSAKDKNFDEPREFRLPGKSWIDFYRRTLKVNKETIYPCSVHDCEKVGTDGGHVEVYYSIGDNHQFRYYGILPLCRSHNAQGRKLRSDANDKILNEGEGFGLVLIRTCEIALLDERRYTIN